MNDGRRLLTLLTLLSLLSLLSLPDQRAEALAVPRSGTAAGGELGARSEQTLAGADGEELAAHREAKQPAPFGTTDIGASIGKYSLQCHMQLYTTAQYTNADEIEAEVKRGNEEVIVYVEGEGAKAFGTDFLVLQDNEQYLILFRSYPPSGTSEVLTLNKGTGVLHDTKQVGLLDATTTYVFICGLL